MPAVQLLLSRHGVLCPSRYDEINCDEVQDLSICKAEFLMKMVRDSDRNGGLLHTTKLRIVGDALQSINAWSGALEDAFAFFMSKMPDYAQVVLNVSMRCPILHVNFARAEFEEFSIAHELQVRSNAAFTSHCSLFRKATYARAVLRRLRPSSAPCSSPPRPMQRWGYCSSRCVPSEKHAPQSHPPSRPFR